MDSKIGEPGDRLSERENGRFVYVYWLKGCC